MSRISLKAHRNNLLKVPLPKGDLGGSGLRNDRYSTEPTIGFPNAIDRELETENLIPTPLP
jgi:hypothetical protein